MVKPSMFSDEILDYINDHLHDDPYQILLKESPFSDVSMEAIVRQIQGLRIAKTKYPFLLDYQQYQFPKKESLEQASSEKTALYKSKLMKGQSFADLTGGMGIDSYLLGRNFSKSIYVEPDSSLFQSTMANFSILAYDQCIGVNEDCESFIASNSDHFDWIYLDPSRRIDGKRKTSISNYQPNIVELKSKILATGDNVMIKLSPMQDISECVSELRCIQHIWIISVNNDVKELLLHLTPKEYQSPNLTLVNLSDNDPQEYGASYKDRNLTITTAQTKKYIYQPAPVLVKSELQNHHALQFGMEKLHQNTQLYTHDEKIDSYFGRIFEISALIPSNKKEIRKHLPNAKANIITKNFPLSPSQLAKKLAIKDGGEDYLLGYTDHQNKKLLAVAKRLK